MKKKEARWEFPYRFILSVLIIAVKVSAVAFSLVILGVNIPYFSLIIRGLGLVFAFKILCSQDNPDYKLPWLLIIMAAPGIGSLLYMMFYSRILPARYVKRLLRALALSEFPKDHTGEAELLLKNDRAAFAQAGLLCSLSGSHLYSRADIRYFSSGEEMFYSLMDDIKSAESFIFLEYYIVKDGELLSRISELLTERAVEGIDVRILYDDVGSLASLSRSFLKKCKASGIVLLPFSRLKGVLDSEFNNRNHRKIAVIDGNIAYTGSANIADEYAGIDRTLGKWKDSALRLCGRSVLELYRLFIIDCSLNCREGEFPKPLNIPGEKAKGKGFLIPFGDGPRPLYSSRVGKSIIISMLGYAQESAYIMTPYLVIDSELLCAVENCAARGVAVSIFLPERPDRKFIGLVTRDIISRLISAGVRIYFYTEGFLHAKMYLVDGRYAIVGSMNLDNRSLSHNFECGVWMYGTECISDIERDFKGVELSSRRVYERDVRIPWYKRLAAIPLRIFSPLL